MELRQLRQFVAVAEEHSFRRAADRLCMAQPPLSVAIRKLEDEIGVPLLERGSRGVMLTPAGAAALEAARRCLSVAEEVRVAARLAADGETGRLRIGFIGSVTFELLPRLIQAFRQRHGQVTLDLRESTNMELLSLVENHQLDLAFVRLPVVRVTGVALRTIQQDVFCVALPPGHPLAQYPALSIQQLEGETCIGFTPSRMGGLHAGMSQLLDECGIALRIAQEAVQVQTVVGLVGSGLGIALIPSANAPYMSSSVEFRRLTDVPANVRIGIALIYRVGDDSPVLKRFLDLIEQQGSDPAARSDELHPPPARKTTKHGDDV